MPSGENCVTPRMLLLPGVGIKRFGRKRELAPRGHGASRNQSEHELEQWLEAYSNTLFQHIDVLFAAHLFEHLRPHRHAYLAEVRLFEQGHVSA